MNTERIITEFDPICFHVDLCIEPADKLKKLRYGIARELFKEELKDGCTTFTPQQGQIPRLQKIAAIYQRLIFDKEIDNSRWDWINIFLHLKMPEFTTRILETFATPQNIKTYELSFQLIYMDDKKAEEIIGPYKKRFGID